MRRFTAIARTAAIETMSQPLSAILFPVAVLAIHILPAFQYHRFFSVFTDNRFRVYRRIIFQRRRIQLGSQQ